MGTGKVFQADNKIYHGNSVKVFYTKLPNIKPIFFNNKLVKNIYVIFVDGTPHVQLNVQNARFLNVLVIR